MYKHQRELIRKDQNDEPYGTKCCREEKEKKTECDYDDEGELLYEIEVSDDDDGPIPLPKEMLEAAERGDVGVIKDYVNKEYDVNSRCEGEDLLSRACAMGQTEVLELLLRCPNVHLNSIFELGTPLVRAARGGHLDCVRIILGVSGKCRPYLHNGWKSIAKVLKQKPSLSQGAVLHILKWAGYKGQWESVRLVLHTDHYIPENYLYHLIMQAISKNKWDVVDEVLRRNFSGKAEILNEIFGVAVKLRLWDKVRQLLHMMSLDLRLEEPLVEAALDGDADEVHRLLDVHGSDVQALNACLLVISAGGTSESVVHLMMDIRRTYIRKTLSDALFLAYLEEQSPLLLPLLSNSEASYSFHDLYRTRKAYHHSSCHVCYVDDALDPRGKLLDQALERKALTMGI